MMRGSKTKTKNPHRIAPHHAERFSKIKTHRTVPYRAYNATR